MEKERDKESSVVYGDATNIVANMVSKFYYSSISLYTKRVVTLHWPHVHLTSGTPLWGLNVNICLLAHLCFVSSWIFSVYVPIGVIIFFLWSCKSSWYREDIKTLFSKYVQINLLSLPTCLLLWTVGN